MKTSRWSWQNQHVHHKWKSHLIFHNGRKLTWFYLVSTQLCAIGTPPVYLFQERLFFFLILSASGSHFLSKAPCLFGLHGEPALNFLFVCCKTCEGTPQLLHLQLCSHSKVLKIKELARGDCLIWERLYRQWTSVSQLRLMALSAVSCARRCLPKKILKKKFFFPTQRMLI